ncbi:hydantoinase B/oxoprolinase family protein [Bacteroidota bacterium]
MQEGIAEENIEIRSIKIFLRYTGQDNSIPLEYEKNVDLDAQFKRTYEAVYGHSVDRSIEVEAVRVVASDSVEPAASSSLPEKKTQAEPVKHINDEVRVFRTEKLSPGHIFEGPAVLLDNFSTTYIEAGWQYQMYENRTGMLTAHLTGGSATIDRPYEADLELFTNRFMAIAENMGAMLQRTAFSVNIKERLDFSCALLDAKGNLVANAPHIPVHLGGLSVCVKTLLEKMTFKPGDTVVTNHPGFGGSHLPDVTTISPVFDEEAELVGFVVNRAHHSEIGGISPGSMPPAATRLIQEGVVIAPFLLVEKGQANWTAMYEILTEAKFPSRNPDENLADLNAALAANKKGADALLELVKDYGRTKVSGFFDALRKHAAERMKQTLNKIEDGTYKAREELDDGSSLVVKITKTKGNCIIDFTGSAPVHHENMNATVAIVHSVVIYVLRLLLDEPIPLNDGLLEPVEIIVPEGMLNPEFPDDPASCPAVVGGNVEISQRLTDTLLKAFGTMAASQGTMNNVLFGNDRFGYYETLAGGTGAGNGFNGSDAVHHHMTNTRITDPEVIEHRYPVRILKTSIRLDSGGKGKWNGGNGMTRIYEFRESVNLSLLTQRRQSGPYGMAGGEAGKNGEQFLVNQDGEKRKLKGIENLQIDAGDRLEIHTPGGGGYGTRLK